ncbi:MAG: hypothetical protein FJZ08_01320 [Candidatus Omnitrophica bacterium]|nr:hypothetical protein [Candidatus Omnitrophota bacterium]
MLFLLFAGSVAFAFGLLFLFFPKALKDLNDKVKSCMSKFVFSIDEQVYKLRIGVGISLILSSLLAFFVAYFLFKKYS